MAVITTLALEGKVIVGGEQIAVHKWQVNNYHMFTLSQIVSRLQMAILEQDSNNSTGALVLADAESIMSDWKRTKLEWALAKEFRHLAPNAMEVTYSVLAITPNEALRIPNQRLSRVVWSFGTLLQRFFFSDSAKLQYGLTDTDIKRVEQQIGMIDKVIAMYVGDGTEKDLGLEVAAHEQLGVVNPPINLNESTVSEASPSAPGIPQADAPDLPSTVPLPGTGTGVA